MDYQAHLRKLRKNFIEATPGQRLHVASQRIKSGGDGPNLLVAYVAAIEGFARSLAMHQVASTKDELSSVYPRFRNKGTEELIIDYLRAKHDCKPESFFGEDMWTKLGFSINYRNLLAHECTFLGQDKYPDLLSTCEEVLRKLANVEGLKFEAT